jgi:hypothetical protein
MFPSYALRFFSLHLSLLLAIAQSGLSDYTTTNTPTPHDNSKDCSCYVVNSGADSATPTYFQYYRFFDFRNLADRPGQYVDNPPPVNNTQSTGSESVWSPQILDSHAWNTDWAIQNWDKPATDEFPVRLVNSPANIYISQNDSSQDSSTWLTLRTSRLDDFQSAAEMENMQKNVLHCSMRMHARVVGAPGAVAGFFTFLNDRNESDIEILTREPVDTVRYTNQPAVDDDGNEVKEASQAPSDLPSWEEWQTHRIDWLPRNSYWYLNGKQVAANTYSVPRTPSFVVLNMWSDGGEWSGNMSVGESAEFQVQWVELVFNSSGPVEGLETKEGETKREVDRLIQKREDEEKCKVVCKVDGVKEVGKPEIVGAAPGLAVSWCLLAAIGTASMLFGVL